MSIGHKAVRGAAWTILSSVGGRVIGVVATLVLTRYIAKADYGDVSAVASAIVITVDELTRFGIFNYIVAKPASGAIAAWHCTVYHLGIGLPALAAVVVFRRQIVPFFGSKGAVKYIPGMAAVLAIERIATGPERILARDLRFRTIAASSSAAQFLYAALGVVLAMQNFGGYAIVWGNIGQWGVSFIWMALAVKWSEWLKPHKLSMDLTKKIFAFGVPLAVGHAAGSFARTWDNLLMARYFGSATAGQYALAYNLADIPATTVGEHIGDVLLPSFARMDDEERGQALIRASALLALVMFPLAVGLGSVANALTTAIFNEEWASMWPMVAVLSTLSVVRPIGWTVNSFLQVLNRPRTVMMLEITKIGMLLLSIVVLQRFGPLWTCAAPGIAFGANAILSLWMARSAANISMRKLTWGMIPPLFACVPMAAAVIGSHYLFMQIGWAGGPSKFLRVVVLIAEVGIGAIVFVPSALVLAPTVSREFLRLVKTAILRRGGGGEDEEEGEEGEEGEGERAEGEGDAPKAEAETDEPKADDDAPKADDDDDKKEPDKS